MRVISHDSHAGGFEGSRITTWMIQLNLVTGLIIYIIGFNDVGMVYIYI